MPAYSFSFRNLAAIYSAPVVGAILGLVVGHFLFDLIGRLYARYHNGRLEPENRLIILYLVLPLKIIGYNLIGVTLHNAQTWSWWVLAIGWAMHNFATIITTTAVGAYLLDAYPEAGGECAAWINFARTLGKWRTPRTKPILHNPSSFYTSLLTPTSHNNQVASLSDTSSSTGPPKPARRRNTASRPASWAEHS